MLHFFFSFTFFCFFFFFYYQTQFLLLFLRVGSIYAGLHMRRKKPGIRKEKRKEKENYHFVWGSISSSFIVSKLHLVWLIFKLTTYYLKFNTLSIKLWLKFKLSIIKIFYPILFNLMFFFFLNFWRKET